MLIIICFITVNRYGYNNEPPFKNYMNKILVSSFKK